MNSQEAAAYLAANPDVKAAYDLNSYGLSPEQFAATHYEKFGVDEKRPLTVSDRQAEAYAAQNPDVARAANQNAGARDGQLSLIKDHMATHAGTEHRAIPTEAEAIQILSPGSVAAQQAAGTYQQPLRAGIAVDQNGNVVTKQTPTAEGQVRGEAWAGEPQAAIDARAAAAAAASRRPDVDPNSPQGQARAAIEANKTRMQALNAWRDQVRQQPWYDDFMKMRTRAGESPWSYDIRGNQSTNRMNELVDRFGTWDPLEYAAKNGLPPPDAAGWQADPMRWQRDTSANPFLGRQAEQELSGRQAQASHEAAGGGLRLPPAAARQNGPADPLPPVNGLISGAQGVAPQPPKPQPSAPVSLGRRVVNFVRSLL